MPEPKLHFFTRDQLIDAISHLEAYPATAGPGQRVFISAESMADAIIEALGETPKTVHYRWPAVCGGGVAGDLWSGNFDRVTCEACRADEDTRQEEYDRYACKPGPGIRL